MADCKQAKAPVAADQQLPTLTEAEVDITDYQRCIGSLMYPMICMCPDIAFQLVYSHAMSLCYLRGTSHYKLEFQSNNSLITQGIC